METFTVVNTEELAPLARRVLEEVRHTARSGAGVITLSGELGAGKTTFTQLLARALGVAESVTSPTFVVMKQYPLAHDVFDTLVHIDLYRIDSIEELRPLRFSDVLSNTRNLCVIEWPERAGEIIPPDALNLTFSVKNDGTRTITYGN